MVGGSQFYPTAMLGAKVVNHVLRELGKETDISGETSEEGAKAPGKGKEAEGPAFLAYEAVSGCRSRQEGQRCGLGVWFLLVVHRNRRRKASEEL